MKISPMTLHTVGDAIRFSFGHTVSEVDKCAKAAIQAFLKSDEMRAVIEALEHQLDLSERRKDFGEFYLMGKTALSPFTFDNDGE